MSTTATEPQQSLENQEAASSAQTGIAGTTTAPAAPPAAAPASSSREYVLFEEARTDTWTQIAKAEAGSSEAALETLGEQKLKSGQRFMAIPTRFVRPVKPKVTTTTSISFD